MPTWDAHLYLQFADERTRPSLDLIARINLASSARIMDLGCGPGNSTAMLRRRWPQADITGLDSSREMIAAASQSYPTEKWVLADVADWTAVEPFDLVFSNATLHWLPEHEVLLPRLLSQVAHGGALAVQMPAGSSSPLRRIAAEVADDPHWCHLMGAASRALNTEHPAFYYDVMQPLASRLDLWETEYCHVMESPQAIVDWFRGTGLRPYLEALETDAQRQRFEQMILDGYTRAYPRQQDGRVLFPFRRLFMVAYR